VAERPELLGEDLQAAAGGKLEEGGAASGCISSLCLTRSSPVVAGHGLEGRIGNTAIKVFELQYAYQRIAAANALIEEGEGFARGVALDPEGHTTQVHCQRVLIDSINAIVDDFPHRFANTLGSRLLLTRAHAGQLFSDAAGRREEKVPRSAGGIANSEGEKGFLGE